MKPQHSYPGDGTRDQQSRAPVPDRRWAATALLREAMLRLHDEYEALPRPARRTWWATLAIGFLLVELLALGLVWVGRRLEASGALRWEADVLRWFDTEAPLSFNTAMWMEGVGNGFVLWALVLFCAGFAAWMRRPLRCLALLVGYTGVYPPVATAWAAWARERPDLIARGLGSPGGFLHSYPSGHMVQTVFAYGLLVYLWMRVARSGAERVAALLVLLLMLAVVAICRLRLGAHWPSDLLAGLAIGAAWTAVVLVALRRAERLGEP